MLYGGPGTGKSEFAKNLVERLGFQGYQVEDTAEDQSPATRKERLASLVLSQIFAPARQSILVLDEAEDIFQGDYNNRNEPRDAKSEPSKSWMNALLEGEKTVTALVLDSDWSGTTGVNNQERWLKYAEENNNGSAAFFIIHALDEEATPRKVQYIDDDAVFVGKVVRDGTKTYIIGRRTAL